MDDGKLLKITYHAGSADKSKINAYKMPPPFYTLLKSEIAIWIFDKHKQPKTEVVTYWIDEDGDDIEVDDQCDYEIFLSKRSGRRHLHVAPIRLDDSKKSRAKNSTDIDQVNPNVKRVHGCKIAPIVGFSYNKNIQCFNYDLCEKCDMNHMHAEHMMMRINMNEPNLIQTKQATNETPALKISDDKDKVTDTSLTTPVLSSPVFENVTQYVDPQYMKAGIKVLNNFSEMYAIMIDPMEVGNVSGSQGPVQPAAVFPQQRKSSVSSTASSNVSTAITSSITSDKDDQQSESQTQIPAFETFEKDGAVGVTSYEPVSTADIEQTPERRRSQSEETEWQIIDQQRMIETPIDTLVDILPSAGSPKTSVKTPNVQLSKDLQAHIDQAKLRDQQTKEEPQIKTSSSAAPSLAATPPIAVPGENLGTSIYHADPSINTAVHAMMAMGFSNEGARLTQLVESVSGRISQALDLMSGAGHNKNVTKINKSLNKNTEMETTTLTDEACIQHMSEVCPYLADMDVDEALNNQLGLNQPSVIDSEAINSNLPSPTKEKMDLTLEEETRELRSLVAAKRPVTRSHTSSPKKGISFHVTDEGKSLTMDIPERTYEWVEVLEMLDKIKKKFQPFLDRKSSMKFNPPNNYTVTWTLKDLETSHENFLQPRKASVNSPSEQVAQWPRTELGTNRLSDHFDRLKRGVVIQPQIFGLPDLNITTKSRGFDIASLTSYYEKNPVPNDTMRLIAEILHHKGILKKVNLTYNLSQPMPLP